MKYIISLLTLFSIALKMQAQNVGIGTNTPSPSALLELQSANKGLLLPRVADTSSVNSPAKGLLVYANVNNGVWYYDGNRWLQLKAAENNDANWFAFEDSIVKTNKKYVGINTDYNLFKPQEGLQVNGSLVIHQPTSHITTAPTPAQTYTMNNTASIQSYLVTDSSGRVFDPGGPGANYINNVQGNIEIPNHPLMTGISFTFNNSDFGLAAGDTLWISNSYFPACRNDYYYRAISNTTAGETVNIATPNVSAKIIFRSNGDNLNAAGFDITWKRSFSTRPPKAISTTGNSLVFNSSNGVFGAGFLSLANAGDNSTLLGYNVSATGRYSTAIGRLATASADNAVAIGYAAAASQFSSFAIGFGANASGNTAMAFGNNSKASGTFTTAFGSSTNASSYNSTAFGRFNDSVSTSNKTSWVPTDPLLYAGNGSSEVSRSNALLIYKNGNTDMNGFTRLGESANGAPRIKTKKITGYNTPSSANPNSFTFVPHGIADASKILSINVLVNIPGNFDFLPHSTETGYVYTVNTDPTGGGVGPNIAVGVKSLALSSGIMARPIRIFITYEE